MAEHTLPVIIQVRYDTLSRWMNSRVILKKGEIAIAEVTNENALYPNTSAPENTPHAIGMKVGDGQKYFYELPWVQAVAGDVYSWAKSSTKPSYDASEIANLGTFIDDQLALGIQPRLYQIVRGTGKSINKYYLQYQTTAGGAWITDTSRSIDLSELAKISDWIGSEIDDPNYASLGARMSGHINYRVGLLNYEDAAVEHLFVTSVSESGGIVSVTRAQPVFDDISGTLGVTKGGTGLTTLPSGEVLVGNGTGAITSIPIADEIANNTYLVPNYLIKAYVDQKTAGLTGAMHYIGEAVAEMDLDTDPAMDPLIEDYDFANAKPGDVITYNLRELVWTGEYWRPFGDEGSYIVHGTITDTDIVANANIQMSKISGLTAALADKVTAVAGMGLSSNDFTTAEKEKLASLVVGASDNVIEHIFVNGTECVPTTVDGNEKSVSLTIAVFDAAHAAKLDAIEANAQVNILEHVFVNGDPLTITTIDEVAKSVNIEFNPYTLEDQNKLASIASGAQVNTIEHIIVNGTQINPTEINGVAKTVNINIREYPVSDATKLQNIAAGAQVNTIEHIFVNNIECDIGTVNNLAKSVNISFLAYTEAERIKLQGIATGAQVNVLEGVQVNGTDLQISNKKVNITFLEYTQEEKQKLNGIAAGAQVNVLEKIIINNQTTYTPNAQKEINIDIDSYINNVITVEGAEVPGVSEGSTETVTITNKLLQLSRIAKTGKIQDLVQDEETYIILDCGTSDSDVHQSPNE